MNKREQQSPAEIGAEAERFRAGFRSVVIATVGADGAPDASYAPYITDSDHHFFICVSGLARHTRNLAETARADLLFLQDEGAAANLFARVRLSYACRAELIARETAEWTPLTDRFERAFGDIAAVLRTLPDFRVFRLVPLSGRYVRGFGQAYHLAGPDWSEARPLRPGPPAGAR
jgi:putative heme iron utilization protein